MAALGELGEAANILKKVRRGDLTIDNARDDVGRELADTVTYIFLLASRLDIDLGAAVVKKFNEVSDRVKSPIKLPEP